MINAFSGEDIIINILSGITSLFSLIIILSLLLFKSKLTKQDCFLTQKYIGQFGFFLSYIILSVYNATLIDKQINKMNSTVLGGYLIFIYLITFCINYEHQLSFRDPTHVLRFLIKKSKSFLLYDLFIIIFIGGFVTIDLLFPTTSTEAYDISKNITLLILLFVPSTMNFIFFGFNKRNYHNNIPYSRKNLNIGNSINVSINILLFLFCAFLLLPKIMPTFIPNNIAVSIIKYFIYSIGVLDSFLNMAIIYHSGFYFYSLGMSHMGGCYCCFGCNRNYYSPILYSENSSYKTNDVHYFMVNLYNRIGYIIEDYVVDAFDYMLNMSTLSLSLVYGRYANGKFVFIKNQNQNDFKINIEQNITMSGLINKTEEVEVRIESFFSEKIKEILNVYHIKIESIIQSLLSGKGQSLLSKNTKDHYFTNLTTLCLKTFDKKLLIEIYDDVTIEDKKMKSLLSNYLNHLNFSQMNTFLPILLGVFTVKINSFKEVTMFITLNPLIEEYPKENYNYWQLMRYKDNELQKISCSKDRDSFIITTDQIFSQNVTFKIDSYDIFVQTIESDLKFLKKIGSEKFSFIILYYELELNDKKSLKTKNTILPIYSEDSFQEDNNIIQINQPKKQKIEVISSGSNSEKEISLMNREDKSNTLYSKKNQNVITESLTEQFMGVDHDNSNDKNRNNSIDQISMIQYDNKYSVTGITKNGFDSIYNNYKGIVYFSFENLFEMGGCFRSNKFYFNYLNEIKKLFSSME